MSGLREDFAAASEKHRLRFAANLIEELSEKCLSDRKIREQLSKIGADVELADRAFEVAKDEGLESEYTRAKAEAERLMAAAGEKTPRTIRKTLSRLAYLGFQEEIIYEIAELYQE